MHIQRIPWRQGGCLYSQTKRQLRASANGLLLQRPPRHIIFMPHSDLLPTPFIKLCNTSPYADASSPTIEIDLSRLDTVLLETR